MAEATAKVGVLILKSILRNKMDTGLLVRRMSKVATFRGFISKLGQLQLQKILLYFMTGLKWASCCQSKRLLVQLFVTVGCAHLCDRTLLGLNSQGFHSIQMKILIRPFLIPPVRSGFFWTLLMGCKTFACVFGASVGSNYGAGQNQGLRLAAAIFFKCVFFGA